MNEILYSGAITILVIIVIIIGIILFNKLLQDIEIELKFSIANLIKLELKTRKYSN